MNGSVVGFFSYAHADNACEQNRILRLAELVRDEYSLTTGQDLTLLTDRTDARWAGEWRDRIRAGLDTATFLIPVITPRYFREPQCRQELLDFTGSARRSGAAELVLPIVYTHTRELADPTDQDEAVGLVRRMRCEKWHDLRADDEKSVAHRRAVSRLTARLAAILERTPLRYNESRADYGAPRVLDVVSALAEAVPRWDEAFGMLDNAMTRIDALTEKLQLELANTPFDQGNAIGRLAILRTYADEVMKPARDVLTLGAAFADEVIQLDPSILGLLHRVGRENPPTKAEDFVDHCCSLILATARQLRQAAGVVRDYGSSMSAIAGLSEILDDPVNDVAVGVRSMLDGIALISEWESLIPSPGGQTE
ncbi:MAG TPA: toll/interleukin-1 receptor domain-containing protein [Pseudonocardiaceae bacterium]